MARILFIFPRKTPYDSKSVRELPSGGTEKATVFLAEALRKLGHIVEIHTTPEQINNYLAKTAVINIKLKSVRHIDAKPVKIYDVVVTQVAELLEHFPECKRVWMTHHFSNQEVIQKNAAFARCFADQTITLSQCHHDDFKKELRIESTIIGHGVWMDELCRSSDIQRDPFRLIYASTPFRGLERIPKLFKEIKSREPRASIAICSSMGTYGESEKDAEYQAIFDELATIEGVELLGALNQKELYEQYAKASVFFYPSIWPETYCLALDEAIAHGCLPITTGLGALSERTHIQSLNPDKNLVAWVAFFFRDHLWNVNPTQPRDWMDVARQWEQEVLNV